MGVFHWGHLVGSKDFSRVGSNVYIVDKGRLYFPGLSRWVSKKSNMFDILPTLPESCSRPWLSPPGNQLVLVTSSLITSSLVLISSSLVLSRNWFVFCQLSSAHLQSSSA